MEAFGVGLDDACRICGVELTWEVCVSLLQNIERPRWRRAAEHAAGAGAVGAHELGPEWAEALTRTPREAQALHFKMNAERMYVRARAGKGRA